jgi:hypothetical protein
MPPRLHLTFSIRQVTPLPGATGLTKRLTYRLLIAYPQSYYLFRKTR